MGLRTLARLTLPLLVLPLLLTAGCPAVFPELATRTKPATPGIPLDPGPPAGMYWLRILSARVPPKTRDGRTWQPSGKNADAYAKLFVNGKEIWKTPVHENTLTPTWPNGPRGNVMLGPADKLRIELWDSNSLNDSPIGVKDVPRFDPETLLDKRLRIEMNGGAEMELSVEPAHAVIGLGLWFELRQESCYITRMLPQSPAERAGLKGGDQVLEIGKRKVSDMTPDEMKSAFNAVPFDGLAISVKHAEGAVLALTLKEGPIYPPYTEFGNVD